MSLEKEEPEFRNGITGTYEEIGEIGKLPKDELKLLKFLGTIQSKLHEIRREKMRKDFGNTPEGKRVAKQIEEMKRSNEAAMKKQTEILGNELHQAKIDVVIRLIAEEALRSKRFILTREDPRVSAAVLERRRLEHAKAKFEHEIL